MKIKVGMEFEVDTRTESVADIEKRISTLVDDVTKYVTGTFRMRYTGEYCYVTEEDKEYDDGVFFYPEA